MINQHMGLATDQDRGNMAMRATQIINVCQSMFIIIDHIQEYSTNLTHISKLEVSRNDTITIQCGIHCHTPIQNFYKTGIWLTSQVLVFQQHQSVVNVSVPLLGPPPPAARERTRVHPKTLALQLFPSAMTTNPSQHQNGVIWMIGKWYSNLNRTTTDCLKKKGTAKLDPNSRLASWCSRPNSHVWQCPGSRGEKSQKEIAGWGTNGPTCDLGCVLHDPHFWVC
jgi:hypothetical protein